MLSRRQVMVAAGTALLLPTAASAAVSYLVPGTIPKLKQPSSDTCWAATATMMYSWRHAASHTIASVVAVAGTRFAQAFANNQGLAARDKPAFLTALGLRAEVPQNFTVAGWYNLLRSHGPLWVTSNEGSQQNFAIHARIIRGIVGDESPAGTSFFVIDPATGADTQETVRDFIQKFESVARIDLGDTGDLRPQVVHF